MLAGFGRAHYVASHNQIRPNVADTLPLMLLQHCSQVLIYLPAILHKEHSSCPSGADDIALWHLLLRPILERCLTKSVDLKL